ncbi:circadian clock protein KaiC [Accumulibacter sp.]|uniref:circadian clock protein KaiC n=1 Tax=Accumulibacter sp. TaxID=2053492 RepID=UPI0025ED2FF7|nr:circadian clock protein KaiC [Accumulibacter sp.]MCM8611488.1 circadian clock protein KaiC [Accumulibacter sp.]MCM8635122.1 circadian clock protein KaiC [Accumulibacter sp.]MCM8641045.1 circadian clock protein KaiC [Accumulibacter sp.]
MNAPSPVLDKCPTGIAGFDDLCLGGVPRGRATLLAGQAGAGKTLFAMSFVLNGIERCGEPGVFVSFEENPGELAVNMASLGFDLERLQKEKRLHLLHLHLDPHELIEAGEFDLDGVFLRLGAAIDAIGARRIALDAVENLFSSFSDLRILRGEFHRLLNWIKDKGITAIVTTERGRDSITRHGLEKYLADCVVTLDNRVDAQIATRRLRIVKYRGSAHASDECPFILDRNGFSVMPITSAGLAYPVSTERVSTGIPSLDAMLVGGIFCGSSVLVTGTAGTGKSSIAAHLVDAACRRGERCLYVALEESPDQVERNMSSIGFDLAQWRRAGLLRFHASRPTSSGLETHLATVFALVDEFQPKFVVVDPISAFSTASNDEPVKLMLIRMVDRFKSRGITSLFNALTSGNTMAESTAIGVSSLMDVWFLLRNLELAGERTRGLYVCKARGMAHSNQIREFLLTDEGVRLVDVVLDDNGQLLTGSARQMYKSQKEGDAAMRRAAAGRRRAALDNRRQVVEAKIAAMRAEFDEELRVLEAELSQEDADQDAAERAAAAMASRRSGGSRRDEDQ